jgi:hypothetical protein
MFYASAWIAPQAAAMRANNAQSTCDYLFKTALPGAFARRQIGGS